MIGPAALPSAVAIPPQTPIGPRNMCDSQVALRRGLTSSPMAMQTIRAPRTFFNWAPSNPLSISAPAADPQQHPRQEPSYLMKGGGPAVVERREEVADHQVQQEPAHRLFHRERQRHQRRDEDPHRRQPGLHEANEQGNEGEDQVRFGGDGYDPFLWPSGQVRAKRAQLDEKHAFSTPPVNRFSFTRRSGILFIRRHCRSCG